MPVIPLNLIISGKPLWESISDKALLKNKTGLPRTKSQTFSQTFRLDGYRVFTKIIMRFKKVVARYVYIHYISFRYREISKNDG